MIEINLLPEELRRSARKPESHSKAKNIFSYIILSFIVLLCVHILLSVMLAINSLQLLTLNNKWRKLEPQRKLLEDTERKSRGLSKESEAISQISRQKRNWPEKLNKLSLDLPPGIWFKEISATQKEFLLRATVVSLQKEEMTLINKFIDNLKNDTAFFKDFSKIELVSVNKKVIGGYEVADFVLTGAYK